jgi:hypothetical protein
MRDIDRDDPDCLARESEEDVNLMWKQARGELLSFSRALDRSNAQITASQIRMALRLADEAVGLRMEFVPDPD